MLVKGATGRLRVKGMNVMHIVQSIPKQCYASTDKHPEEAMRLQSTYWMTFTIIFLQTKKMITKKDDNERNI